MAKKEFDFTQWVKFSKKLEKDTLELLVDEVKEWAFLTFHDIVDTTPLDTGTLRESLNVDFNDKRMASGIRTGGTGTADITWVDVVRDKKITIIFSANTIYAEYVHEGIDYRTGLKIKFREPKAIDHFITANIEKHKKDLLDRIHKVINGR
jgi:hypothetical protein